MKTIDMVCNKCGGNNVRRDAWAAWNPQSQKWELQSVFDAAVCDDCDGETRLVEVPVDIFSPWDLWKRFLQEIDTEIENRKTGGNAEDWASLQTLSDQGHRVLRRLESHSE